MRKILLHIFFAVLFFIIFPCKVSAVDFKSNVDLTYSVGENGVMHVKDIRTIVNNSDRYYMKSTSYETFIIQIFKTRVEDSGENLQKAAETISVKNEYGQTLNSNITTGEDRIEIQVPYGSDIRKGGRKTIIFEYDNYELTEKNGKVWNIYIPGMSEEYLGVDTSENGAVTKKDFSVSLEVSKSLGETNFVLPEPSGESEENSKKIYRFQPDSLINQAAWIQIGTEQYYYFEIEQEITSSTALSSKVFYTFYDLVLPREVEGGSQKVYFTSIEPEPEYIKLDGEGNAIARFKFTNEEETTVLVKGYMTTEVTDKIESSQSGNLDDIDYSKIYAVVDEDEITYEDLTKASIYWEVDTPEIQTKATELLGDEKNVYKILLNDYNFIIDNVNYDELKTGINNQRQGALNTLKGGSSVCMEFSDLLITLLRAQGVPARAAFGYGFDPKARSGTEEGHQWVEVYIPNIGWVPVDPTWGDTGRRDYIGSDLDHALWRVASIDVETPSPVTKYSILDDSELKSPTFKIDVVEEIPNSNLLTFDVLLNQYKYSPKHELQEKIDQLNKYGKVVFLGIPSFIILIIILSLVLSIINRLRKVKLHKNIKDSQVNSLTPEDP